MRDYYRILGVSPGATDDEVKTAYRDLVKRLHPDNYENNPLQDVATSRMQEINEAYHAIMQERNPRRSESAEGSGRRTTYRGAERSDSERNSTFPDVRRLLQIGRIYEAEEVLSGVPAERRNAEWHYLMGRVAHTRGQMDGAYYYFNAASQMEPQEQEYKQAVDRLNEQRKHAYRSVEEEPGFPHERCCRACGAVACLSIGGSGVCCARGMLRYPCCLF